MSTELPPAEDPTAAEIEERGGIIGTLQRILGGDLGSLRVLIVLAIIWAIFALSNDRFLTAYNLTNLTRQIAAVGTISVGVVLVLLLGEIDLSVGAVSGLAAACMSVLNVKHGWNPYMAIVAGLAVGACIGFFQGSVATRLGIPTFVVTLAGLLAWQGALLQVLGDTGSININAPAITNIALKFLPHWLGWALAAGCAGVIAASNLFTRARRAAAGLEIPPMGVTAFKIIATSAAIIGAVAVVNSDRGVPLSLVILVAIVAGFDQLLTRSRFGRHIYAVGGNEEAARRSGIKVVWLRTAVFTLASTLAAAGGIMAAARLQSVGQSSGGSDLLLLAIAGPVIAGVSLFGGRGSVWSALLGALVIGSISNGMDLLALQSSVQFMVTGGVLLAAVSLDAVASKQRASAGRR